MPQYYVRMAVEYCFGQGMVSGTVVLTYEPCHAFLRTPSSSYEPRSKGRGVGVRSSALGKAFRSDRASGGQSECSDLVGPRGHGVGAAPLGPRRGDSTSVIVEGASLFLDHSGCRMSMSGSVSEG